VSDLDSQKKFVFVRLRASVTELRHVLCANTYTSSLPRSVPDVRLPPGVLLQGFLAGRRYRTLKRLERDPRARWCESWACEPGPFCLERGLGSFGAPVCFPLESLAGGRPGALKIIEWYPRAPFYMFSIF
jgi:hypothetical protein